MLVYGSIVVGGMVLLGYNIGFHPGITFFWILWYVGMFISVFSFGFLD